MHKHENAPKCIVIKVAEKCLYHANVSVKIYTTHACKCIEHFCKDLSRIIVMKLAKCMPWIE